MATAATAAPHILSRILHADVNVINDTTGWSARNSCRGGPVERPATTFAGPSGCKPHAGNSIEPRQRRLLPRGGVHRIAQHADSCDADLDDIAGDQRADTGGRFRGDRGSGVPRPDAGTPEDQESAGEEA